MVEILANTGGKARAIVLLLTLWQKQSEWVSLQRVLELKKLERTVLISHLLGKTLLRENLNVVWRVQRHTFIALLPRHATVQDRSM